MTVNRSDAGSPREGVPVARPRPARRRPPRTAGVRTGSDAGLTLIGITGLLSVLGWVAGGVVGIPIFGTMIGGLAGVVLGFAAVYVRFRDL